MEGVVHLNFPTFDLTGRVALVTGGSKGIGFGMAQALGKYGAKVLISGRGEIEGENAEKMLKEGNIDATFYSFDVSKKSEVEDSIRRMIEKHERIDILVNNAGMNIRKPLTEIEEDDWDKVININLKGIFLVGQEVSRQMMKQKYGKIINISSIFGTTGYPFQSSYAASKGGINQLTRVWASELAPFNITVNAIAPGYIKTPMTSEWLSNPERFNKIVENTMIKRIGDVTDLVGPVIFLSSETSAYVTGQILHVDGGWTSL
jgi:gluconate 5-dehydrogenase